MKRLDARFAVRWMSKCYSLASVWQVSSDDLRRHQICELYSSGYDRLAEEVVLVTLSCFSVLSVFDKVTVTLRTDTKYVNYIPVAVITWLRRWYWVLYSHLQWELVTGRVMA